MFKPTDWKQIREQNPLIHQITNVVTVNDCANITLACGASPVMADAVEEVEEMVSISNALTINIGTLNQSHIEAMCLAGKRANILGIPVVLDPVGVGATHFRYETVQRLLREVHFSVIRGNASEISTLCGKRSGKGVDAAGTRAQDLETEFRSLANDLQTVLSVSGPIDYVTDGSREAWISNGTPTLSQVTGTGCMLTALTGSCLGTGLDPFVGALLVLVAVGVAGEKAEKACLEEDGIGTFRIKFFDQISRFTGEELIKDGKVRVNHA